MKNKSKILVSIAVILTIVFAMTFSFAAYGEKQNCKTEVTPAQDRLQQRIRLRDRECCDCICDCEGLRIRIRDKECIEELLLYKGLQQKLQQANINKNNDEVEKLKPQLERVRTRICEMKIQRQQIVEQLKLQLKEMIKNKVTNKEINRLRYRIRTIETEIEKIVSIIG